MQLCSKELFLKSSMWDWTTREGQMILCGIENKKKTRYSNKKNRKCEKKNNCDYFDLLEGFTSSEKNSLTWEENGL